MTDDRITLPLWHVRASAVLLCDFLRCRDAAEHDPACLKPLLRDRDDLLAADAARRPTQGIDPDCLIGGAKHLACTGCLCDCHRHSNRGAA